MKVFINPGHAPNGIPDPGVIGNLLRESDVAAAVRSNSLHIKYNELKQRVNAAETVEEVEAIHWPED